MSHLNFINTQYSFIRKESKLDFVNRDVKFKNLKKLDLKIKNHALQDEKIRQNIKFELNSDYKIAVDERNRIYVQVINKNSGKLMYSIPFHSAHKLHPNLSYKLSILLNALA